MERDQTLIALWGLMCCVLKKDDVEPFELLCHDDPLNAHALVLWLAITATTEVLS
jgi:hypothetical protein